MRTIRCLWLCLIVPLKKKNFSLNFFLSSIFIRTLIKEPVYVLYTYMTEKSVTIMMSLNIKTLVTGVHVMNKLQDKEETLFHL